MQGKNAMGAFGKYGVIAATAAAVATLNGAQAQAQPVTTKPAQAFAHPKSGKAATAPRIKTAAQLSETLQGCQVAVFGDIHTDAAQHETFAKTLPLLKEQGFTGVGLELPTGMNEDIAALQKEIKLYAFGADTTSARLKDIYARANYVEDKTWTNGHMRDDMAAIIVAATQQGMTVKGIDTRNDTDGDMKRCSPGGGAMSDAELIKFTKMKIRDSRLKSESFGGGMTKYNMSRETENAQVTREFLAEQGAGGKIAVMIGRAHTDVDAKNPRYVSELQKAGVATTSIGLSDSAIYRFSMPTHADIDNDKLRADLDTRNSAAPSATATTPLKRGPSAFAPI